MKTSLQSSLWWVGNDDFGLPVRVPLEQLPHLLVVGQSGSGKSHFLSEAITDLTAARTEPIELFRVAPGAASTVADRTGFGLRAGVHVIATVRTVAPGPRCERTLRNFPARLVLRTGARAKSELLLGHGHGHGHGHASEFRGRRDAELVSPLVSREAQQRLRIDRPPEPVGELDALLPVIHELVRIEGSVDSETVQRLCEVGYGRAVRILDQLVSLGVVLRAGDAPTRHVLASSAPSESVVSARIGDTTAFRTTNEQN